MAGLGLSSDVASAARRGALLLGLATAICWPLTIQRDALRARQRFIALASVEIAGVLAWSALMVALGLGGASLTALVAASGTMPGSSVCSPRRLHGPTRNGRAGARAPSAGTTGAS